MGHGVRNAARKIWSRVRAHGREMQARRHVLVAQQARRISAAIRIRAYPTRGCLDVSACHLTGQSGASCGNGSTDQSGFPVVYEAPSWRLFEATWTPCLHYSASGGGSGIGRYIGYIRIGLANGGENLPICTTSGTAGVWPSPQGLTFALNPTNGVSPDWFAYANPCTTDASCQGKYAYIGGSPNGVQGDGPGYVLTVFHAFQASRTTYSGSGFPRPSWQTRIPGRQRMPRIRVGPIRSRHLHAALRLLHGCWLSRAIAQRV